MKYFEVTFTTTPCNETVNDVVSALAGEIGFESFVEWENGVQAYVQQSLFDEESLKEMIANFPLPDTPQRARNSPASTCKSTPCKVGAAAAG